MNPTTQHTPVPERSSHRRSANPLWSVQVFARSLAVAAAHERMMHTWWTWLILWMGRLVAEISFFALIGRLIGDEEAVSFLLIGTAMLAPAYATMFVAQSVRGLMFDGLVPYLIAAPAPSYPAALGRALHWCLDGVIAGTLGLLVGNQVFSLGLSASQMAKLIALVALSPAAMIGTGMLLGAVVSRIPSTSSLLAGLARSILGLFCGATFAVSFLPGWLQPISKAIPLTYLVSAARGVQAGTGIGLDLWWAAITGVVWLAGSYFVVRRQFERSRRTGNFV